MDRKQEDWAATAGSSERGGNVLSMLRCKTIQIFGDFTFDTCIELRVAQIPLIQD